MKVHKNTKKSLNNLKSNNNFFWLELDLGQVHIFWLFVCMTQTYQFSIKVFN